MIIDTVYTIELHKNYHCMAYPVGTPVHSMLWLKTADDFKLYRTQYLTNGCALVKDLTWRLRQFQELWRIRRAILRRALRYLLARERGEFYSLGAN
jgi:hypothetical protein